MAEAEAARRRTWQAERLLWKGYQKGSRNRGRDVRYRAPPAQIRTCGIPAYGSHLGCLTAKRCCGQG